MFVGAGSWGGLRAIFTGLERGYGLAEMWTIEA